MIISKKCAGAERGGEMVACPSLMKRYSGGGPPQEGRGGESKDPFHHRHPQGALFARVTSGGESPEVFGMEESTPPILTSGGCWGDPPTN